MLCQQVMHKAMTFTCAILQMKLHCSQYGKGQRTKL
jgi:hypothetical protein